MADNESAPCPGSRAAIEAWDQKADEMLSENTKAALATANRLFPLDSYVDAANRQVLKAVAESDVGGRGIAANSRLLIHQYDFDSLPPPANDPHTTQERTARVRPLSRRVWDTVTGKHV